MRYNRASYQRGVQFHPAQKRLDSPPRIAQAGVTITAFLIQQAESRMLLLQTLQGF